MGVAIAASIGVTIVFSIIVSLADCTTTFDELERNDPLVAELLRDYNRFESPQKGTGQPTYVSLGVYVNSFHSISEVTMDYSLSIYMRQSWTDPRLKFQLPDNEQNRSIKLHEGMWNMLWVPDTFFRNEKRARFHYATISNRLMSLTNEGEVWYAIKLSLVLDCQMCLLKFPMDTQECPMIMESFGYKSEMLTFDWLKKPKKPIEIDKSVQLPQFRLSHTKTENCSQQYVSGHYSCLKIIFVLQRDFGYYLTQMYIPTILIVVLSWVGFWISIDSVPARVSLGLLTVLTITTQRSAATSSLPRVSYVKAMDVWMATCLIFVFASFLEFAIISYVSNQDESEQKALKKKIQKNGISEKNRNLSHKSSNYNHNFFPRRDHSYDASLNSYVLATDEYLGGTETCAMMKDEQAKEVMVMKQRRKAQRIDAVSRWLFPLLFSIFNLTYWFTYLNQEDGQCSEGGSG